MKEPKIYCNINYANTTDKEQELDLYIPSSENFPTVIYVHGGSWRTGEKEEYTQIGNYFQSKNIGCAIINYRLYPRVLFPDPIYDTAKSIAWIKNNISSYNGNNKIFLFGHSAGGQMVSLLASDNKYLESVSANAKDLSGVISVSGLYLLNYNVNFYGVRKVFKNCNKAEVSSINKLYADMPPFLIFYAEKDIPTFERQAKKFYDAYISKGNNGKIFSVPGNDHITIHLSLTEEGNIFESEILNFLHK